MTSSSARSPAPPDSTSRHSLGLLGGRTRRPVSGRPVTLWVRGLPHFDQMTVGIADVAALLELVLFRRRQEFSTPGAPFGVHGLDVFNPDIEEAADRSGSRGVSRMTVGLSSVGPPPALMTIQLLASATLTGSPGKATLPPSTSV